MFCPECGTPNSADALFCTRCNAPLAPTRGSDDALPPWLRQLESVTPPAPPSSATPTGLPDWLQSPAAPPEAVAPSQPEPPGGELPPWLRELEPTAPSVHVAPASPMSGSDELPSWLRELQDTTPLLPASSEPAPQLALEPDREPLPSWLADLQPSDDAQSSAAIQPSADPQTGGDLPDWLRDAAPPASAPPSAPPASNLPPWLHVDAAPSTPSLASSDMAGDDIPAWLRDVAPADQRPASSVPVPTSSSGGELPPWLQADVPAFAEAPTSLPASDLPSLAQNQSTAPSSSSAAPNDDIPDWLRDVSLPTAPVTPAPTPPESFPAWLQADAEAPVDTATNDRAATASVEDMPGWLHEPTPAESHTAPDSTALEIAPSDPDDDIPDWLQELQPRPEPAAPSFQPDKNAVIEQRRSTTGELPAWLRDFDSEPPIVDISAEELTLPATASNDVPAWLREPSGAATTQNIPSAPAEAAPDDIPAWLRTIDAPTPPAARPSAASPEPSPDWLQSTAAQSQERAAMPAAPGDDVPGWLRTNDAPTPPAATQLPAPPADDVPEWLRIADESVPVVAPIPPESAASSNIPAWLQQSGSGAPALNLDDLALDEPTSNAGGVPDWLRDIDAQAQTTVQNTTGTDTPIAAATAAPPTPVPGWLQTDTAAPAANAMPSWMREDVSPADGLEADRGEQPDVPAWLRDESPPAAAQPDSATTRQPEGEGASPVADLPDWLRADLPAAPVPTTRLEPAPTGRLDDPAGSPAAKVAPSWLLDDEPTAPALPDEEGMLGNVDLPVWLRQSVAPVEQPAEPEPNAAAGSPDWLRAFGVPDTHEPTTEQPQTSRRLDIALPPTIDRSPERVAAVALLQSLVMQPLPAPTPVVVPAPSRWWHKIGVERLIALLLLPTILAALLLPNLNLGSGNSRLGGKTADLYRYIETLTPDSRVLIAYEADLRRSAELAPLEQAIVSHIVAKGIPTVILSTDVQGALVAGQRIQQLEKPESSYKPGSQYLNLGYVAGGDTALRRLAQNARTMISDELIRMNPTNDVNTLGVMSRLNSNLQYDSPIISDMKDFDLVIIMADEPGDVQQWIEQVWASYTAMPIALLTPVETAPLIQPMIQVKGDFYPVVGLAGAQNYAALSGTSQGNPAPLNAISLGSLVIVVLIVGGGMAGIRRRMRQKGNG